MGVTRKVWSRDELLVAFRLYCRTAFGRLHRGNPEIAALAGGLGRTPSAVAMKLCNFASLDPAHQARGISGLGNAAAGDREVFEAFAADWEGLALESEAALERLGLAGLADVGEEAGAEYSELETEAVRSVKVRRVQALFRATVMASYNFTCAISGIAIPALLQASHIVPWSRDAGRRLDPRNGIALSALHDRAFDRGLITLDEELRVVVAGVVRAGRPSEVHRVALLEIEGKRLRLPTRFAPDAAALAWHREKVFVGKGRFASELRGESRK